MKPILMSLVIFLSAVQLNAQSFGKVYEANSPNDADRVNWNLSNAQVLNLRIDLLDANVPENIRVNISDLTTKVPITFELDPTQSGAVIKGRLRVDKDTRLGLKTISVLVNDTPFIKATKNFILYSTSPPSAGAPATLTPIVNNVAEVTLVIRNLMNFRTMYIGGPMGKEDLFLVELGEMDLMNQQQKIKVFCPDASFISANHFIYLVDNNGTEHKSLKISQVFSFNSTTNRFDQLQFYRGDKEEIVIPNSKKYPLTPPATYVLNGLNTLPVDLTFDGTRLRSTQKIDIQRAKEDCEILQDASDISKYRIRIKVKEIPKIDGSISWTEEDNTSLDDGGYVDHLRDKIFNVVFNGVGLEELPERFANISFSGTTNSMRFTQISRQDGTYRGTIGVPKSTSPGKYIIKYVVDNRIFDLGSINVHELCTSNTNMAVGAYFQNGKTFDMRKLVEFVENADWDAVNGLISMKLENKDDVGSQRVTLSIKIKNDKGTTVAQYSKIFTIVEDGAVVIKPDPREYDWIDAEGAVKDWYVYEVSLSWQSNSASTNSNILSRTTKFILKGKNRSFVTPQLSVPFSQTVFIFADSLKAAPYNIGLNLNIRYWSVSEALTVSPVYWGAGFYFSQGDLLDEQAMQFGTVLYVGLVYPTTPNTNKFHISLGVGPNFNIKFKEDANKDNAVSTAMVLNIGYNFGGF